MRAEEARRLLGERGLAPLKSLGQHFLVAPAAVERILGALEASPADEVLEIGPGLGALTEPLAETGASVVAVEVDAGLYRFLEERLGGRVRLVHGDYLALERGSLWSAGGTRKVVGNLPYYCTSEMVMEVLAEPGLERAVLTVQEEYARRLEAVPGGRDYGAITVAVSAAARLERVGRIPPSAFYPAPSVSSVVLRLWPRGDASPALADGRFRRVVRAAFGQRRKRLENALAAGLGIGREEAVRLMREAGLVPGCRAEDVPAEAYVAMAERL